MAIYPDKKGDQLTGRFRVELQHKDFGRYRQRFDSYKDAQAAETSVKASWERGESHDGRPVLKAGEEVHTLATTVEKAKGVLWKGNPGEETSWAHIREVAAILGANTKLDDIDTLSVDKVIAALSKRGKADATVNRYLSHFRTLLVWAKGRKYRTVPVTEISFSWNKERPGRIRWLSFEEQAAGLAFLRSREREEADRVATLIEVALETGCRRDELLTAEKDQVHGTRLHLWKTKTDSPRTVPMTLETTQKLLWLLEVGMPTRRGLRSWWERMKEHMGLQDDGDFVFHACRHTRATRLLDAGVNVLIIKEWMGHKRIETTLRYTHVKPANLEDALRMVGEYEGKLAQEAQKTALS